MTKMQLEVLLALISYVCFGIAYTLHDDGTPLEMVDEAREKIPELDAADMAAPLLVRGLLAFIWVLFMLIWPWYLAKDIGYWIWDHTFGRRKKKEGKDENE